MIQVIHGKKGSGKTKKLINMTNDAAKEPHGDIVFIDDDNRYMFDLLHEVRFVNAGDYGMASPEMFYGFLCGMISQNFDIREIYVDAFLKLVNVAPKDTQWFFEKLERLAEEHELLVVLSISCDDAEAPDFIRKYFI